ncbi:MAG: hypothetical protein ABEJ25_04185, partial [Candidatus Bipolaricaulia bacterium]
MRISSLTVSLIAVLLVLSLGVHSGATTTLGGSLEKNFTDDELLYGAYLRTGGLFKLELGG